MRLIDAAHTTTEIITIENCMDMIDKLPIGDDEND